MNKSLVVSLLVLALAVVVSAKEHPEDFTLTVHVTAVQSDHGYSSNGSLATNADGKVSGSSSGQSYNYSVYTVKIDGSPVTYQMGNTFAMNGRHNVPSLHIGDYKGRWKNNILELLYLTDKDKDKVQHLRVIGEQAGL